MSKIRTLIKINYKQLKNILVLEDKKLDLAFLILNLGKFPFFSNFFLNLAKF